MIRKFNNFKNFLLLLFVIFAVLSSNAQNMLDASIPFILLKEKGSEVEFEKIMIPENQTKEIRNSEVITFILPLSEGKAASFTNKIDREGTIIVENENNSLTVGIRSADGKEKFFPSVSYEDLKSFLIRVNIVKGDGTKQAYKIDGYDKISADSGPVLDLFGGMIPMENDDYSVTLETKIKSESSMINGLCLLQKWKIGWWLRQNLPGAKPGSLSLIRVLQVV